MLEEQFIQGTDSEIRTGGQEHILVLIPCP
jgi:hypothetical protein